MSSRDRPDYRNLYNENGPLDKYDRYCMALGLPNPRSRDFENWRNFADSAWSRPAATRPSGGATATAGRLRPCWS